MTTTIGHWVHGTTTMGKATRIRPVWNPAQGEVQAGLALAEESDTRGTAGIVRWPHSDASFDMPPAR